MESNIEKLVSKIEEISKDYQNIFEHTKVGIAYVDENGAFFKVNDKFCEIVGYEKEELLTLSFKDITYEEDLNKDLKVHTQSKEDGSDSFTLEKRYIKKDGSLVYAEIFINHVRDENGNFEYTFGVVTDITKRKKIQDSILEQTKTMQMYLDIVDVMIIGLDKNGNITLVNRKSCEILGFEEYELLGRNWFKNYLPDSVNEGVYSYFLQIINGEADLATRFTNDIKTKNGIRTIAWRNNIIYDKKKNIIGVVSSGEDITEVLKLEEEKKRNEKALFNQSKLASMGEMLRNIAHQWRQPLSTISTAASGIKLQKEMQILKEEDLNSGMDLIVDTTKYLSQTIDDFQNYFKMDSKEREFLCKDLFDNLRNLVSSNFKSKNIELIIEDNTNEEIYAPFNELLQIVINVVNNSYDAMQENDFDNKMVSIKSMVENNYLSIIVEDNAGGIPETIINRIFEPYFTTKHQSLGTGIGLYMTKDIIENRFEGSIEVENKEIEFKEVKKMGASFKLSLPLNK